jgi:hypothetical protein
MRQVEGAGRDESRPVARPVGSNDNARRAREHKQPPAFSTDITPAGYQYYKRRTRRPEIADHVADIATGSLHVVQCD